MYHNIVYLKSTNLIFFFHICYVWNWSLLIFIGGLALIVIIIYYNGSNNSDKNKNNDSNNSNKITTTTIMTITKFLHHNPHIGIEWSTVYLFIFFLKENEMSPCYWPENDESFVLYCGHHVKIVCLVGAYYLQLVVCDLTEHDASFASWSDIWHVGLVFIARRLVIHKIEFYTILNIIIYYNGGCNSDKNWQLQ